MMFSNFGVLVVYLATTICRNLEFARSWQRISMHVAVQYILVYFDIFTYHTFSCGQKENSRGVLSVAASRVNFFLAPCFEF